MRILTSFVLLFCCFAATASAGEILEFGMPDDYINRQSLAVLKAAYSRLGIEVEGKPMPAGRALIESKEGRTDGEVGRIKALETQLPNLVRIPVPINHLRGMACIHDPTLPVSDWKSLAPYRVGICRGVRFAEAHTRELRRVVSRTTPEELMELLDSHRVDVVVLTESNIRAWKEAHPYKTVTVCPKPLIEVHIYHYLNRKYVHLVPQLTAILQEMLNSGELDSILESVAVR
ncbi:transporter substrate-binding domain-containing protein [Pseudodesulfovibrio cashew]|uniref:Transporter substrate-binding domain-containing protein n=1 Tax=Pseudodesulfovibrio cashew TaxID=2678688 RepID=A0A6I6JC35_9BACT|nr:transporter substrate-binding domain-containing protein [Pseudodesulfovibrio cashew]QGY38600.1 transporter substrate-binding domain-containing protein [Pseudodesulfovibrio cashew]